MVLVRSSTTTSPKRDIVASPVMPCSSPILLKTSRSIKNMWVVYHQLLSECTGRLHDTSRRLRGGGSGIQIADRLQGAMEKGEWMRLSLGCEDRMIFTMHSLHTIILTDQLNGYRKSALEGPHHGCMVIIWPFPSLF